jgi:hypothetical protein
MKFQAAAMSRSDTPEDDRVDFSLYVDEFQNFSTDSFATIMSEARKYHLNLIVANQFTTQLTDEIRDAVFGNIGTIVSFRIGQNDVEGLGRYFQPIFDGDDLLRVPNHNTIVRTLIGGVPTQPFSMATLPSLGTPNPRLGEALKQLAAAKYGRSRADIEKDINTRLGMRSAPTADAAAPFAGPAPATGFAPPAPSMGGAPPAAPAQPPAPASGSSFLDDWLNKRRSGATAPQVQPYAPPTQPANTFATPPASPPQPANSFSAPAPMTSVAPSGQPTEAEMPKITLKSKTMLVADPDEPASQAPQPAGPVQFQTAAAPSPQMPPTETKNISSSTNEQSEVDKIAAELKQQLGGSRTGGRGAPKTEHTSELKPGEDDTIFIDRDGTFHLNQDD